MINIILFGPPGSGKGTQATTLVETFGLTHVSTGDLFRYEMGNNTPLGIQAKSFMDKGHLVPDEVTIGMLKNKVESVDDTKGFILDGFPRTIPQCKALDEFLSGKGQKIDALIALDVEDEEIVTRLLERGKSSGRKDDANEEVIRNRIKVYNDETAPVYNYYDKKGVASTVNGIGSIEDIFGRLSELVKSYL